VDTPLGQNTVLIEASLVEVKINGDGGDDFVGIGGPYEGFGVIVGFPEEAVDGAPEIVDRAEHATLEAASGQFGEEALDRVERGGRGRRVVPAQPGPRLGVLVRDYIDDLARGDIGPRLRSST
jgi:hypothetical protein